MNVPISIARRAPIELRQQREQGALVGADLHARVRQPRGLGAQAALHVGLVRDLLRDITLDRFGE